MNTLIKNFNIAAENKSVGSNVPLFDNGRVTRAGLEAHREKLMNKTVEQIAELFAANGYDLTRRDSVNKDSTAQILAVNNPSCERNVKQIQISPDGSSRHGNVPYVKISTSNAGKIKIIDGTPDAYKTDGAEKAYLIFRRNTGATIEHSKKSLKNI